MFTTRIRIACTPSRRTRCLVAGAAALAVLASLSATATGKPRAPKPSAAAPIVTGVDRGGGPYLTVFDPSGTWQAGFLPYLDFSVGGIHVATGDVNGDGKTEVLTAPGRGGRADLRAFDGAGAQQFSLFAGAGTCGTQISAADVNGDGTDDLVAGNDTCGSPNIQVFDGKTRKRIAFFGAYSDPNGKDGVRVGAGDVTGDSKAEIVTGNAPGELPTVRVFAGVPSGFFPAPLRTFQAFDDNARSGVQVAVADVNGDGKDDIVAGAETPDDAQVKVFDGPTGTLLKTIHAFGLVSPGTLSVAAGDLDGDGKAEILASAQITSWGQQQVVAYSADGTQVASFLGPFWSRQSIAVGDVDGTGKAQVVVTPGPGYVADVAVVDPTSGAVREFDAYDYSFTGGVRVAVGDLGGDGYSEWVAGQGPGGTSELGVYDGSGAELLQLHPFGKVWNGLYVAVGDVNGDRKADIVAGADAFEEPRIEVYDGHGIELSSFLAFDSAFTLGVRVAVGDVDGDGTAEIVAGAGPGGPPLVRVFALDGTRKASFYAFDPLFSGGVYVAAADVDGDGTAEIVTGAGQGGGPEVRVFDANGKQLSSFNAYESSFTGGVHVAAGDVDGDGYAEIVTGPGTGRPADVSTFRSDGTMIDSFRAHPDFQGGWFVAAQTPLGPKLQAHLMSIASGVEGSPLSVTATVTDPGGTLPAGDFAASVDWGDGTISAGEIVALGSGSYEVRGAHGYRRHGSYAVSIRVADTRLRAATIETDAKVADATLSARGRTVRASRLTFRGAVATLNDGNRLALARDFTATIDWGDGRRSTGRIVGKGKGRFEVVGGHHYTRPGEFRVVVRIRNADGGRATARSVLRAAA